ncbi:MAG: amino acid adenylation domain-containing protein, partial [Psychrosphaera sp.]|nr:amino acid adenylation domain-containing protein [Psychrosphaera sp.]
QIMFSMNTNETNTQQLTDVTLSPLEGDESRQVAKFDLTLDAIQSESGLSFEFEFNRDLFDSQTIEVLGQHLVRLLDSIVANQQTRINELSMLSEDEQHYLLHTLNPAVASTLIDDELPIHELFERQVKATPNNIALAFVDEDLIAGDPLSYLTLNQKANQLAHYLRAQGVKPDTLVGLSVERSLNMVIALLAILKAGGAYVPLDPDYPQDRIDHMIKDSGVQLVLTQKVLADLQPLLLSQPVTDLPRLESYSPNNLAYVIYTSGSTGLPKGVMVEHQSVAAHVSQVIKQLDFTEEDQVLQFASVSFDTFIEQSFAALGAGATLHLRSAQVWSAQQFYRYTDKMKISITDLSPSYLTELLVSKNGVVNSSDTARYWQETTLTRLVVGGEALPSGTVKRWFESSVGQKSGQKCRLFNAYGPTEATITSTLAEVQKEASTVCIGRAFGHRQLYLLDKTQQLVPFGAIGELYIGGGLARGYLNQPALTAERFITNPFGEGRLYQTGDWVRYMPNGNLVFIGRSDDQIKIRGFRIELGEIEHQLSQVSAVKSAVVLARQDPSIVQPGQSRLVAYITVEGDISVSKVRDELSARLPDY